MVAKLKNRGKGQPPPSKPAQTASSGAIAHAYQNILLKAAKKPDIYFMRIVPVFKVRDMRMALKHYTDVLDFVMTDPADTADSPVVDLGNGDAAFQITICEGDRLFGSVANVWVDDVDALFTKYKSRGLDTSGKEGSLVEQGPIDQAWGRREFYVRDADGNTLRFVQPLKG